MPGTEKATNQRTNEEYDKPVASIIFPKTGFTFKRPASQFEPDAYTHGGISLQEMIIPMVVMKVKQEEQGLVLLSPITGPKELVEVKKLSGECVCLRGRFRFRERAACRGRGNLCR